MLALLGTTGMQERRFEHSSSNTKKSASADVPNLRTVSAANPDLICREFDVRLY